MTSKATTLRIARPTDNLREIANMYLKGLDLHVLATFNDHDGFDGVILGHPGHNFHFEFTHHKGTKVGKAPTQDNLLVFYVAEKSEWNNCIHNMRSAGFQEVRSYNPYWDEAGKTFEDLDGYRVVIEGRDWQE